MGELPKKLQSKLEAREVNNALRSFVSHQNVIDFSSNDYLGFSREVTIHDDALEILRKKGIGANGATGSRLLSGNHVLYQELENLLCEHHDAEAALVFNSGYDANLGFFSSVPQRGDVVFYDELVHASIRDGVQMGNAKSYKFAHCDLYQLKKKVETSLGAQWRSTDSQIYIVTESVFSMDGDTPDLRMFSEFCSQNGYHLIVDEAHATGIFGDGTDMITELGLQEKVFARIITFGKAMGCHAAAVLGSESIKTYLINFARSLIYSTAQSPYSIALVLASYNYLQKQGREKQHALQQNIKHFKSEVELFGLEEFFIHSDSAVHCLVISGNQRVKELSEYLRREGFDVRPILSPTVKEGNERLRFCLHAFNTKEEISRVLKLVKKGLN